MLPGNSNRRGGPQNARGRGAAAWFQRSPREELKASAKVASAGCFLLQYRTDVTTWLKGLSIVANRKCPIIGRIVDELEYRLPEEVERSDSAVIEDEDDKIIARSIYLKKLEKNLNFISAMDKEKP